MNKTSLTLVSKVIHAAKRDKHGWNLKLIDYSHMCKNKFSSTQFFFFFF